MCPGLNQQSIRETLSDLMAKHLPNVKILLLMVIMNFLSDKTDYFGLKKPNYKVHYHHHQIPQISP